MPPSHPLAAFRNANYRLYFFGQMVSQSGSWMQRVAQSWLVLELTDSPVALGAITAAQFLPILAFGLVGGVLADRLPKRRSLIVLQVIALIQAAILAALTLSGHIQLWELFVSAFVQGTLAAFEGPVRQTFAGEMVERERLRSAISLNSSAYNVGRVLGPAVGGVIIATIGIGWCFFINAGSFFFVLAALVLMNEARLFPVPARPRASVIGELLDGVRYVKLERRLWVPLMVMTIVGIFGLNFSVIVPLLARYAFDVGPVGFGTLNAAQGIGAVVGSFAAAGGGRPRSRTLLRTGVAFGLVLAAIGLSPTFGVGVVLMALIGGLAIFLQAVTTTSLQLTAKEEYRGRVMSILVLLALGSTPVGSPLAGLLADTVGIRVAVMIEGGLVVAGTAVAWVISRQVSAAHHQELVRQNTETSPIP